MERWNCRSGLVAHFANAPGFGQRLVERWQWGGIFSWSSGARLTVTAPVATLNQATTNSTPMLVGGFPKSTGKVTKVANGVTYFSGIQQITDPGSGGITSLQGLNGAVTNKAIADAQGNLLLVNPAPGQIGTLSLRWIEGPPMLQLDMDVVKRADYQEQRIRVPIGCSQHSEPSQFRKSKSEHRQHELWTHHVCLRKSAVYRQCPPEFFEEAPFEKN